MLWASDNNWDTIKLNGIRVGHSRAGQDKAGQRTSVKNTYLLKLQNLLYVYVTLSKAWCTAFVPIHHMCGCAGRFVSYLVGNPEDRFSRDEAHMRLCPSAFHSVECERSRYAGVYSMNWRKSSFRVTNTIHKWGPYRNECCTGDKWGPYKSEFRIGVKVRRWMRAV